MRLRMNRSYLGDRLLGVRVSDLASSLCFAACYLSMIFQLLGGSWQPALRVSAIVFAVILLAYMVGKGLVGTKVIIAGLALVSFTLVDAFVIGSKDLPALMQMYIMFVLGLYLVRCNVLVVVARVIFWIVLASMAYLYSISPNHYEIFPTQGRNFCGAYALLAFMVLAIAATRKDGRVTNELMASAIACLALSVYTVGRGSILACALLVALVFVVRLKNNKGVTSRALSVSMVVIVAVASFFLAMLVDGDLANQLFGRFGSVSAGRSDEARSLRGLSECGALQPGRAAFWDGSSKDRERHHYRYRRQLALLVPSVACELWFGRAVSSRRDGGPRVAKAVDRWKSGRVCRGCRSVRQSNDGHHAGGRNLGHRVFLPSVHGDFAWRIEIEIESIVKGQQ